MTVHSLPDGRFIVAEWFEGNAYFTGRVKRSLRYAPTLEGLAALGVPTYARRYYAEREASRL